MGKKIGQLLLAVGIDFALLLILVYGTLGRGFAETAETGLTGTVSEARMEEKVVALTFDDGPHSVYTKELLEGLKKRGIKATFFLMGSNIEGNEELVRQMKQDGHLIGNHGYRHVQMTEEGAEKVRESVEKTGKIIGEIIGEEPEYLRPPYGDWNEELAEKMDLTPVFWSVDSLDWKYQNTPKITNRVLKDVEDGDIILMHDIFPTSVESALEIVDTLQVQGYTFVTADELIID
ncbi:MAG: polysaccharide deacetylase family protein [Lachnospiraceae bacterium]|jgi:peptidoglycan/xylan/chitin deacetylase (PgdA/CDA1 family)